VERGEWATTCFVVPTSKTEILFITHQAVHVASVLRHLERHLDVALRGQVVNLMRASLPERLRFDEEVGDDDDDD